MSGAHGKANAEFPGALAHREREDSIQPGAPEDHGEDREARHERDCKPGRCEVGADVLLHRPDAVDGYARIHGQELPFDRIRECRRSPGDSEN